MAVTGAKLRDEIRRNLGFGLNDTDDALVDKALCRVRYQVPSPAAWATAGTDATVIIGVTDRQFMVDSVALTVPSNVASDEVVYDTLTFSKSDAAGANTTTVATAVTNAAGTGNLTALVPKACALTATSADRIVPAGWVLSVAKTHASTGTAIPVGSIVEVSGYWV